MSVTNCELLTLPTLVTEKFSVPGLSLTDPAAPPIPLNTTVAAFANPEAATVKAPGTTPFPVGVNTTPTVQLAVGARVAAQAFSTRLKGGPTATERPVTVTLFVFVIVSVWNALVDPITDSVKLICVGLTESPDALWPLPLNGTCTGVTPSVAELTVSVDAFTPTTPGVKTTGAEQLPPLFSIAPQVEAPIAKLRADGPVI